MTKLQSPPSRLCSELRRDLQQQQSPLKEQQRRQIELRRNQGIDHEGHRA
jgi:hypothetical protein